MSKKKIVFILVVVLIFTVGTVSAKFKGGTVFDPKRFAVEVKKLVENQKILVNAQQILANSNQMRKELVFILSNSSDLEDLNNKINTIFKNADYILKDIVNYKDLDKKYRTYSIDFDDYYHRLDLKKEMERQNQENRKNNLSELKELQKTQKENMLLAQNMLNQKDDGLLSERQKNNLLGVVDLQGQNISISQKTSALSTKAEEAIYKLKQKDINEKNQRFLHSLDPYNKSADEERLSPTKKSSMPKFHN